MEALVGMAIGVVGMLVYLKIPRFVSVVKGVLIAKYAPDTIITADDAADKLQAVAVGRLEIANIYASGTEGVEIVTADGWSISIGEIDGRPAYVISAYAPGERYGADWGNDPVEILAERDPELVGLLSLRIWNAIDARLAERQDGQNG